MKYKILRVKWKDERGLVEGARVTATRLDAFELEQLGHEILRVAAECKEDQSAHRWEGGAA
jgi:hypothetical protein